MKRRLIALLLALVAVAGLSVSAAKPAAADGIISDGIEMTCRVATGPVLGTILKTGGKVTGIGGLAGSELCDPIGEAAAKTIKKAWEAVWGSILGDFINSATDATKWIIKKTLTLALLGPSLDLKGTGLWGGESTLAGMLVWLGLLIAVAGVIWQLAKMALTGQVKHAGRAMTGWIENLILSTLGVSLFALLLIIGDAFSAGLVESVFSTDGEAYERIVAVMLPIGVSNPITVLCIVAVLLLVGFIQMVMIFLRQSAIPIICLLIPVAGGGRTGGDATRQWAPKLITSGFVIVAYKPILTIIICTGFSQFGHSSTMVEWLRGCATLVLGILAPAPLTKIFAPFGAAVGGGMAAGGASGARAAAASYMGSKSGDGSDGGDGGGGGEAPDSPVSHAQRVAQSMGNQQGDGGAEGAGTGGDGPGGGSGGGDAQAQAARTEAGAKVPGQAAGGGAEAAGATAGAGTGAAGGGAAAGAGSGAAAAAGPAGAAVAIGIQVLDGVNSAVQQASGEIGNGGQQ
ncbi:hypothetical protein FF041_22115 [Streptomyces jumonjinensis]|uniref:Type IV secretion system protein n=1 Tax=Streptomyces jumonjinensis TaxID=1945 RepID=A0A646KL55_STRJU|nr:hypothetical protein [Streptomyces jumonjinensis]